MNKHAYTIVGGKFRENKSGSQTDSGETNKSHNYCLYLFEVFDLK